MVCDDSMEEPSDLCAWRSTHEVAFPLGLLSEAAFGVHNFWCSAFMLRDIIVAIAWSKIWTMFRFSAAFAARNGRTL